MVKFDSQRSSIKKEKEDNQQRIRNEKNRDMARNFHQADMIRMTEKSNRQMRYFHDKLKKASRVDEKMERVRSLTKEISDLSD